MVKNPGLLACGMGLAQEQSAIVYQHYRSTLIQAEGFNTYQTMGDIRRAILATNAVLIVLSLAAIACRVGRRIILFRGSNWHDGESTTCRLNTPMVTDHLPSSYRPRRDVRNNLLYIANGVYKFWRRPVE
jgi:hypothetical protein